jgi:hypothetical protein
MPTYRALGQEVRIAYGFVPKTCWIADVLEFLGKKTRLAPNRIDPGVRQHPCPAERRSAIIEAVYRLEQQDAQQRGRHL